MQNVSRALLFFPLMALGVAAGASCGDPPASEDAAPDASRETSTMPDAGADHDAGPADSSASDGAPDSAPDLHGNCGPDAIVCNGLCVDSNTDRNNCGGCDHICPLNCVDGKCACDTSYEACGDICANLKTDSFNCGACGHSCLGGNCVDGGCPQCPGPGPCTVCPYNWETLCGSACVDTELDLANCGACGIACHGGAYDTPFCLNRKCGTIGALAMAQDRPTVLFLDDANVYWLTEAGAIYRASKSGTGAAPAIVLDALGTVSSVAMTDDSILFVRSATGTIARARKDGSEHASPVVLAQNEHGAVSVALAGARAYWGAGTALRSAPITGGAAPVTFADVGTTVTLVASDGAQLYWLEPDEPTFPGVYASPLTAPAPTRLSAVRAHNVQPATVAALFVLGGAPFITYAGPLGEPSVARIEANDLWTHVGTYYGPSGPTSNVATDGTTVTWVDDESVDVRPFDAQNSPITNIFREQHSDLGTASVAIDAHYVYVARKFQGTVRRIAR